VLLDTLAQGQHLAVLPRFPLQRLAERFGLLELALPVPPRPRPIYLWCRTTTLEDAGMTAVAELLQQTVVTLSFSPPAPPPTHR
jgi:DNA-binding transcriptional LysR family regulator